MKISKLIPAYKSIIWGGNKLKSECGKQTDLSPLAESWELSLHKDGECSLADGTPLSSAATQEDFGSNLCGFDFFPVLVKLIDANGRLSVQVHPADDYALKNENSLGKTEMWYIVDADEGAGIYLGFKEKLTRDEFERAIEKKSLTDYLRFIPVTPGDCYFIPAGTIHAICSGCLICEIQQNSNITYRVYDYGRRDKNGNERELHVSRALDVTNTDATVPSALNISVSEGVLKGISRFFTATLVEVDGGRIFSKDGASFRCFTCISGEGKIGDMPIKKGESVFVPANHEPFLLDGKFTAMMTTVRKYYLESAKDENTMTARVTSDLGELIAEQSAALDGNFNELCDELLSSLCLTRSDVDIKM